MMTGRAKGKRQGRGIIVVENPLPTVLFAPQLIAAFHNSAGNIVDTQIEWKPGQDGRWDIPPIKDCPADAPQIKFSGFAPETTLDPAVS